MCVFGGKDCEYYDGNRRRDQSGRSQPPNIGDARVLLTDYSKTTGVVYSRLLQPNTMVNGDESNNESMSTIRGQQYMGTQEIF